MRRSRSGFRLKGLKRYSSGGVDYIYHRASGVRLPSLPENDPAFIKAYMSAAEDTPKKAQRAGAGSIEAVTSAYLVSQPFHDLSESYQSLIRRELMKLTGKGATVPFHQIRKQHIISDMKGLAPNAANKRLKAWRCLCKHAHGVHRGDDPSEGIKAIPRKKTEGHTPWTKDDISRYRDYWNIDTPERLALELIYWTGARMSDAVRLGRGMVDSDGWLNFTQKKTGGSVSVPLDRTVPDFCDPTDLASLHQAISSQAKHMTFIVTSYDASRSHKGASQWFARTARTAGITGKTAHGLRKSRSISLAENGATTHQIGAWTGHESLAEVAHYTKNASKKRLLEGPKQERKLSRNFDL